MSKKNHKKYSEKHKEEMMKKSKSELVDMIFRSWKQSEEYLIKILDLEKEKEQ